MWWLTWVACELIVDFDPGETAGEDPSTTAQTGDTGLPPVEGPFVVQGTECSGFVPAAVTPTLPFAIDSTPLSGPVTFTGLELEEFLFVADANVEITVGDVPGPRVTPPGEGTVVLADADDDQLFVVTFCAVENCEAFTLRVTVPAPIDRIIGATGTGGITITEAAITDVLVEANRGDVRVTGDTWGIFAATLDGAVIVDAPSAQIVDLHTSTGPLTMSGSATTELCATSDLGDLDVTSSASALVTLEATNGAITADLASRPQRLDLSIVVGSADVRLPGGAYDIELVSIPESGLVLQGIENEASAEAQITGSSLGTGTILRAR
ncbi:MAG: DUF4097 family beta strand repeat-containing protein [Myxococcota bacterium]